MDPRDLTEVLARWEAGALGAPAAVATPAEVAALRDSLEGVARGAVAALDLGGQPIRLSKRRVTDVLGCERRLVATADLPVAGEAVWIGVLLDLLAEHHALSGRSRPSLLELAEAAGDRGAGAAGWLRGLGAAERAAAEAAVRERAAGLLGRWPAFPGRWWARTQERAVVGLADGEVVVAGQADVTVGGPPTPWPILVVEVKSGLFRREHRDDGLLYALLLALRDGVAPAAAVTVSATGAVHVDVATPERLATAAHRLALAVTAAAELAAGRRPVERPGPWCTGCPAAATCPSAPAAATEQAAA